MGRARHFKAMELSEDGLSVVHSGFLSHATLAAIIARVKQETGETVASSSLQRYRDWWQSEARPAQEAAEMAREVAAALKDHPAEDVRRLIEKKIEQLYLLQLRHLEGKDPLEVAGLALEQQKVTMRRDKLALDTERKRLHEERLTLDKERLDLQREKKAAIDRPALFMEFFRAMTETLVHVDPQAAEVLNRHFDRLMARVKAAHA
jgi:parvulin-like peptidyl-prolyl isomerase